jgi:hypothetical protein
MASDESIHNKADGLKDSTQNRKRPGTDPSEIRKQSELDLPKGRTMTEKSSEYHRW